MSYDKLKLKLSVIIGIIAIIPLPFIGLLLWFFSLTFKGIWFFVLLPLMLILCLTLYIFMMIGFSSLAYKMGPQLKEGTFSMYSTEAFAWLMSVTVLNMINLLRKIGIPGAPLRGLYAGLFPTELGNSLVMEGIIEHSLVDVGENSIIGHNSEVWGHAIEQNKIYIKKVRIGHNCTIGAKTMVMPGAVIGDNTIVGAMSLVPKNKVLEPNSLYVGIPVRKVKHLKP